MTRRFPKNRPSMHSLQEANCSFRIIGIWRRSGTSRVNGHRAIGFGKLYSIKPLPSFYIGSARHDLRKRIANYKSQSKKGWPSRLSQKEFTAKRHYATSLLRMARAQRVPVDLYILTVPSEPVYVGRAPVDLLHGWENGLIRELRPR